MAFSRSTNVMLVLLAACAIWVDFLVVHDSADSLRTSCASELVYDKFGDLRCNDPAGARVLLGQK